MLLHFVSLTAAKALVVKHRQVHESPPPILLFQCDGGIEKGIRSISPER